MKVKFKTVVLGMAVAIFMIPVQSVFSSDSQETVSLRGNVAIDEKNKASTVPKLDFSGMFERAYRQQPPMIPHKVMEYQVDLRVNQCITCHDWPKNVKYGAPKISETHYVDRDGLRLDHVSRTRWNCNLCHVPQANVKSLIKNNFKSALEVD
ncbi:Nitrate reductase cytochrome c550-type subunit [hydrothermal vent metagenome]|uniref:Periplasmic nitrate reductase, electron transfer subunit n=1 Tax=hydrothermal vent metagenome TaxID=652676 RepID=A0A3B0SR91_9ZZZZ